MQAGDYRDLVSMVIADAVDDTLFHLLWAIDDGMLSLAFDGLDLAEQGGGEMAGFYMGDWREAFSKERTYGDFSDI